MIMPYGSFLAAIDRTMSPGQQADEASYEKSVVLSSLSAELVARFGWMGYSPPNTDGWRIPLLELSPFDVSPSKREHWMKVWRKWKEGEQREVFPFSLVYLYGRNKLALYPTANIIPFAEAKRLGLNLPPPTIQRKIQCHQKFTAKEQKLMKGFDEFSKDVGLAPRRRISKRVNALETKDSPSPTPGPRQVSGNSGGRTSLQDSSNRQFSRVVTPPEATPPIKTVLIARSRGLDAEAMELLRQSNPFRLENASASTAATTTTTSIHHPPGFERRDSGLAFHHGAESNDALERCVIDAGRQVWNARTPHPITIDHVAILANFQSSLGVSVTKFTKLVNYWLVHKHHLEKCHNEWFKEFLWFAQTDSDNPWETPPAKSLVGMSNFMSE